MRVARGILTLALGLAAMFAGSNAMVNNAVPAGALMFFVGLAAAASGARKLHRRVDPAAPVVHRHK